MMIKDFELKDRAKLFVLAILGMLFSQFLGGFIEGITSAIQKRPLDLYNILFLSNIFTFLIIYFGLKRFKISIFEKENVSLIQFISVFVSTVILSRIIGIINIYFSINPDNQKQLELIVGNKNYILIILVIGIMAPIVEEIVFRRIIYNLFKNRYVGLMVSICLFSLVHAPKNILEFLVYFMLGLVFTGTYFVTGSLKLAILSHMTNNLIFILGYIAK